MGVSPWPNDSILPTLYLDFAAKQHHKFIKAGATNYSYNMIFDKKPIMLHAHVLFDYKSKGRYCIYEREAHEYNVVVEAARQAAEAAPRASMSYHSDYYQGRGW